MKYLVTGGSGFIGSNFIHYLLRERPDSEITNLDKLTYAGNPDNLKMYESHKQYRFVKGDITDAKLADKLVKTADIVVNFAAETPVDRSISDPEIFVKTNVLGTQVLLNAVNKYNKRFHHISTDEVFGSLTLDDPERFKESTPYDPSSPYSASKAGSDHLVRAYQRTFGVKATISNCSNNYGPYQFIEKFIPLMIIRALAGKPLPIYGDGQNVRDWIHVEDHCAAIDLVLEKGEIGQTYLVGGNAEAANIEIVKNILKILGKGEDLIEFVKDRPGHDKRYAIDSHKIETDLGFKRKYDLEKGLKQTVDWYVDNKGWWEKLMDEKFEQYYSSHYKKK
jgi:dTDP-glucose 4,6-dehydratase